MLVELLADHTELYKQFSDNAAFKKWLADASFLATYNAPEKGRISDVMSGVVSFDFSHFVSNKKIGQISD